MGRIVWQNVEAPNSAYALDAVMRAYDNQAKAVNGLINVGVDFAKTVQQNNHDKVKQYVDSLNRQQLADKVTVQSEIDKIANDSWFGIDRGVVGSYVDNRMPVLNQREVDNINTQVAIDNDVINRSVKSLVPYAFNSKVQGTDEALQAFNDAISQYVPDDPYYQGAVRTQLLQDIPKLATADTNLNKLMGDVQYEMDKRVVGDLAQQAIGLQKDLLSNNPEIKKQATARLSTILANPNVKGNQGLFDKLVDENIEKQRKWELEKAKTEAQIRELDASAKATLQNAQTSATNAETGRMNANTTASNVASQIADREFKQELDAFELAQASLKTKQDSLKKSGLPDTILAKDGNLNGGAVREMFNNVIRQTSLAEKSYDTKYKNLGEYLGSSDTQKLIKGNDSFSSGMFDVVIPKDVADSNRINLIASELNKPVNGKSLPESIKIHIAQKMITNPDGVFTWSGSDSSDIQSFIKDEISTYKTDTESYRNDILKQKVQDTFIKLEQLGYPANAVLDSMGMKSNDTLFNVISPDLQGYIKAKELDKSKSTK